MAREHVASQNDEGARMMAPEHAASQNDGAQLAAGVKSVHDKCTAELNNYLSTEPLLLGKMEPRTTKFVYNNPLLWWKMHDGKFPTLQVFTRKFFAIQASSAPCECVFSQASLLISNKRTRMDATIACKALFVKQNWALWRQGGLFEGYCWKGVRQAQEIRNTKK
jgi:hAT family C-terminal dimerisation region